MNDEKGYVQFHCEWECAGPLVEPMCSALRTWRDRLYQMKLVGVYPDGIGYGNLSCRLQESDRFAITGTATGRLTHLGAEHLTEVIEYDFARNWLRCRGPVQASSESLSHAAVYRSDSTIRAIFHVHHLGLWERLAGHAPTTDPGIEAGTPEMARAVEELFRDGSLGQTGLFVMGGHREGIMTLGGTLDEAGSRLLKALEELELNRK